MEQNKDADSNHEKDHKRRGQKRPRQDEVGPSPQIPTLGPETFSIEGFEEAWKTFRVIHLSSAGNALSSSKKENSISWQDVGAIFERLNNEDKSTWCIENCGEKKQTQLTAATFLKPILTQDRAYCSFLVQKDTSAYESVLEKLPLSDLTWFKAGDVSYESCLWVFFGRNPTSYQKDLGGRAEHTDSVSHDGTWHYQLSGDKHWVLRPTKQLLEHFKNKLSLHESSVWTDTTRFRVECHEGDVLVINTKLWFHQTIIPQQEQPSVSYARDFFFGDSGQERRGISMTNLDGMYATDDIPEGSIIFTEKDMPDCELHRSAQNPNCALVQLEDGTGAVVASKAIASGDFFCLPESSDEESCDYAEEEGDDSDHGS